MHKKVRQVKVLATKVRIKYKIVQYKNPND